MRTRWRYSFGRIVALLGVFGLLLSGVAPAMNHTQFAEATDAVSVPHSHNGHAHTKPPEHAATNSVDGTGDEAPSADCPHHHARTCCSVAGCASTMALATDPPRDSVLFSLQDAFLRTVTRVPAGTDALPVTPPPRRVA